MAKRCTRCLQWKDASEFYRDKSKLDGLKSHCKPCHEAYKPGDRRTPDARRLDENREFWRRWLLRPVVRRLDDQAALMRAWRQRSIDRRKAHMRAYLRKWHAQHRNESRVWQRENH